MQYVFLQRHGICCSTRVSFFLHAGHLGFFGIVLLGGQHNPRPLSTAVRKGKRKVQP